jgi:hypothetical protein
MWHDVVSPGGRFTPANASEEAHLARRVMLRQHRYLAKHFKGKWTTEFLNMKSRACDAASHGIDRLPGLAFHHVRDDARYHVRSGFLALPVATPAVDPS